MNWGGGRQEGGKGNWKLVTQSIFWKRGSKETWFFQWFHCPLRWIWHLESLSDFMWLHAPYNTDFTLPCYLIIANTIETRSEARKSTKQRFLLFHTFVIMAQVKTNCLFQCVLVWRVAVRTLLDDKGLSSSSPNCRTSFPEGNYNCSHTVYKILVHKSKEVVLSSLYWELFFNSIVYFLLWNFFQ